MRDMHDAINEISIPRNSTQLMKLNRNHNFQKVPIQNSLTLRPKPVARTANKNIKVVTSNATVKDNITSVNVGGNM